MQRPIGIHFCFFLGINSAVGFKFISLISSFKKPASSVPSLPNVNGGTANMVNGYIRPLSVENHKTGGHSTTVNNGSSLNLNNNNNSNTNRINDFKSPHSQSQFNLDSGLKKTKNFLQEKSAVSFFFNIYIYRSKSIFFIIFYLFLIHRNIYPF